MTATTATVNATVTAFNAVALADTINDALAAGTLVDVNGVVPVSKWGTPAAKSWGNGTVSVTVAAKAKGKFNDVFFKVGSPIAIHLG